MLRITVLGIAGACVVAATLCGAASGDQFRSASTAKSPVIPHRPSSPHDRPLLPNPRTSPALVLHTTTYAYDGHFDNGSVSQANVRRWLNFAEGAGQTTPDKEVTDGDHCVNTCSVFYTDFARLDSGNQPSSDFLTPGNGFIECGIVSPSTADWVLHTVPPPACSASTETQPVTGNPNGNYGNLTGVGAAYLAYVQGSYSHCNPTCVDSDWNLHDYIFQDTTSYDQHHDTKCCAATLEFASNTTYDAALTAFENTLVHVAGGPFTAGQAYLNILNGFADDGQTADDNGDVTCKFCLQDFGSTHVTIGVCEFCQQNGSPGSYDMHDMFVPYTVNTASQVIGGGHQFINVAEYNSADFTRGTDQVGASSEDRYMLYATYMLYYQPNDSKKAILMEDFDDHATSSTFNGVFPEQALVGYGTPAVALVTYVPDSHTPGIGLGGCTPSEGDSGGISAYLISGTCVHRADNSNWLGEYGQIYSNGSYPTSGLTGAPVSIGAIAFVINLTDVAKTVPCAWFTGHGYTSTTFNHEILISSNGDVLNGGGLSISAAGFSCGTTTIPADSARFLGA